MNTISTRDELISLLPKKLKIAELGVFDGSFSALLIRICDPKNIYLVDVFEGVTCSGDKDGNSVRYLNLEEQFNILSGYYLTNQNVKVVKSTSEKFLTSLPDGFLDAVYIDADHAYSSVIKDLELSLIKVKKGGFIMGHDYTTKFFPGVVQAVEEFCLKHGKRISYLTQDGCPSYLIIND
jgi:Methyltransferase domain